MDDAWDDAWEALALRAALGAAARPRATTREWRFEAATRIEEKTRTPCMCR